MLDGLTFALRKYVVNVVHRPTVRVNRNLVGDKNKTQT